ncbi:MAG: sigma-70 family RNA polymerase sigma factor [Hydrococcus sp. Prado102]|nr:sigma-70 family RNA polymerase sigma factor [Hydrococcus sp. Prado102]
MAKVLADNQAGTTDAELVIQCQRGDRTAFRQLYRRYQQRVRSTLYQLCGSEMLDDLVQEVFLRVWKGLPNLQKPSYFSTWLYRISWNVATDRRRQLAKTRPEGELYEETSEDDSPMSKIASRPQDTPDLMKLHYQDLVQRSLECLSLEHRVVLVLHDLEDLPQKEVAKILNLPLGTVKSRLFYARHEIRKFLQQQGAI